MTTLDRMVAAAERTAAYPYRLWGFGEGPGLLGVLAAAELAGREDLVDRVHDLVAPTLDRAPAAEDHLIAVEVLLTLDRLRPLPGVAAACARWVAVVEGAARPVGAGPPVHRPDLAPWDTTVWVDCLHTDGPGLAALGRPSAVPLLLEHLRVLQDGSGLCSHGFDVRAAAMNGVHWGRGQGWALLGLVGTLAQVSDAEASQRLHLLLGGLARHERDGTWRTVVDDPGAPHEASVSALVAAGVLGGVRDGVLDDRWEALGRRALRAAEAAVVGDGLPVSAATPVGPLRSYREPATGVFPWGQGPLLLAWAAARGWRPAAVVAA